MYHFDLIPDREIHEVRLELRKPYSLSHNYVDVDIYNFVEDIVYLNTNDIARRLYIYFTPSSADISTDRLKATYLCET